MSDHYTPDTRLTAVQVASSPGGWFSLKYTPAEAHLWRRYQGLTFGQKAILKSDLNEKGFLTGRQIDDAATMKVEAPKVEPETDTEGTEYASVDNPLTDRFAGPLHNRFLDIDRRRA